MLNRCSECQDGKKLTSTAEDGSGALCPDESRDPGQVPGKEALSLHYESYEKLEYTLKDGTVKEKKDFVSKTVPFSEYKAKFVEYYPKFVAHHNDAKWHDDDFISLKSKLPCGHCGLVIDYAENYSHEPCEEHQSKYFCQVGTPFTHACMHSQTCFQLLHCMHACILKLCLQLLTIAASLAFAHRSRRPSSLWCSCSMLRI